GSGHVDGVGGAVGVSEAAHRARVRHRYDGPEPPTVDLAALGAGGGVVVVQYVIPDDHVGVSATYSFPGTGAVDARAVTEDEPGGFVGGGVLDQLRPDFLDHGSDPAEERFGLVGGLREQVAPDPGLVDAAPRRRVHAQRLGLAVFAGRHQRQTAAVHRELGPFPMQRRHRQPAAALGP